jgi:hypothetical protein
MTSLISRPARVGLITDQTGALSFMGVANVNLAKMVTDDINAHGGLLGRPVELYVEDSATDDEVAHTAAARLVREADVDVVIGGIYSSTRQAIKRPVVDEAAKLYIYPEQYEGQESHPLIFCTGPVPAQQLDPFIPWLMRQTRAGKFYMPSADYIWPHTLNKKVRDLVTSRGGEIVGEEYFPWRPIVVASTASGGSASSAPTERARSQLWISRSPIRNPASSCFGIPPNSGTLPVSCEESDSRASKAARIRSQLLPGAVYAPSRRPPSACQLRV